MLRYEIKEMALRRGKRRLRGTVKLKPIEVSRGAERSYLAALTSLLIGIRNEIKRSVLPIADAEIKSNLKMASQPGTVAAGKDRRTFDIRHDDFRDLREAADRLVGIAEIKVAKVVRLEGKRNRKAFIRSMTNAFGVDLSAIIREEDISDYLETAAARSANLIKGLSDDAVKRVQETVTSHLIGGGSRTELRTKLTKQLKISKSKADLIARDQMGKLNADLNRIRQQQAGIDDYIWRTSRDERVRDLHARLEGNEYSYNEQTGAEGGLPPGQPIRCRCIAQPIVRFD